MIDQIDLVSAAILRRTSDAVRRSTWPECSAAAVEADLRDAAVLGLADVHQLALEVRSGTDTADGVTSVWSRVVLLVGVDQQVLTTRVTFDPHPHAHDHVHPWWQPLTMLALLGLGFLAVPFVRLAGWWRARRGRP